VLERDSYICAYCGNDADEADHIIPKVQGGKDEMSNLVAACKRCNGTKSDRVLARINYVNKRWLARL
jgi:5-methylcytosine-specific restriction endonuclease McrA